MLTRSCTERMSLFTDISPQRVAVHFKNELRVIYWFCSGCGIYLFKQSYFHLDDGLTFVFIYLSQMPQKRGFVAFLNSFFRTQMVPFPPCHKSQMNLDVSPSFLVKCVSVLSLSGRRCPSTMWQQAYSTREITWTARCLTATATFWPASLWRSSLVRFLYVL